MHAVVQIGIIVDVLPVCRVNILKALVGRIPPNPLWAEVLFQRQEQAKNTALAAPSR